MGILDFWIVMGRKFYADVKKGTDLVGKVLDNGEDCFVNASTNALWRLVRV